MSGSGGPDVIVIGAGTAGVTAARELARTGFSVTVVEGRSRVGGRVYSLRDFCGEPVEGGAELIHGVGAATWPEVCAAGVSVRPCPASRTLFNLGGATRWLPWLLLHPGVWPSFTILRAVARLEPPDLSAREFIERRHYRGRARLMAEMVLTAHLPGSLDEVGVLGLVGDGVLALETGVNHRVVEGYDRVLACMAQGLDIRFGFAVERIEWSAKRAAVCSAAGEELAAPAAVCTLPVGVLQSGRPQFVPDLPEGKRSALAHMVMGPVCKLLMQFSEPFWPRWAAMIGCGVGPVTLYWPVFWGVDDKPAVLIAYCTGPRAAALGRVGESTAADIVLRDLARLFPHADPRRRLVAYRRVDWTTDPFSLGGYTFLRPGGVGARARLAAADTGALFWAGSATERQPKAATVEAAYLSGLRAAREVRAAMEGGCR